MYKHINEPQNSNDLEWARQRTEHLYSHALSRARASAKILWDKMRMALSLNYSVWIHGANNWDEVFAVYFLWL